MSRGEDLRISFQILGGTQTQDDAKNNERHPSVSAPREKPVYLHLGSALSDYCLSFWLASSLAGREHYIVQEDHHLDGQSAQLCRLWASIWQLGQMCALKRSKLAH